MTRSRAEEECKTLGEAYDEGYEQGRCDAIEELVKLIENEMPYDICDGNEAIEEIKKIAEKMKEQS